MWGGEKQDFRAAGPAENLPIQLTALRLGASSLFFLLHRHVGTESDWQGVKPYRRLGRPSVSLSHKDTDLTPAAVQPV